MKLIPLKGKNGTGLYAQVSDEDYEEVSKYKWYSRKGGNIIYASGRKIIGETYRGTVQMHRIIMQLTNPKEIVDHIDHNGLNNQRENLRVVTVAQNQANSCKRLKEGEASSKYKGVYYGKIRNKMYWVANCSWNGIKKVKCCNTEVEAAVAYNQMATEMHGKYACINIITAEDMLEYEKIVVFNKSIIGKSYCAYCKQHLPYEKFLKGTPGKCKTDGYKTNCRKCDYQYNKKRKEKKKCTIQQQN
jgi:hypothetical protein